MKEVKILLRDLRCYPENAFVYPSEEADDSKGGLVVKTYQGEELGFIEIGGESEVIL